MTVKTFDVIGELFDFKVFAKVDTVLSDEVAAAIARMYHRKLEILPDGERR